MSVKYFLYLFVTVVVLYAMDSVNLNGIFKKNKILQARIFYFLVALALIYLITNFIFDFVEVSRIIEWKNKRTKKESIKFIFSVKLLMRWERWKN